MKKYHQQFDFVDISAEELVRVLDQEYPIKMKTDKLVDRVSARYPLIPKSDVALIIKYTFQTIRELLILGKMLYFPKLFQKMILFFYRRPLLSEFYHRKGEITTGVKIKMKTVEGLR
jgi:hypothetical protein